MKLHIVSDFERLYMHAILTRRDYFCPSHDIGLYPIPKEAAALIQQESVERANGQDFSMPIMYSYTL